MKMTSMPDTQSPTDSDPTELRLAEVQAAVRRFVVQSYCDGRGEGIELETSLVASGIIDSAGVLHLVEWLEEAFSIQIEDDAVSAENFDCIASLAELVVRLRAVR
ncbi:MAG: acyl carrier protein [Planctomycetota bacterium]|nr:acyl carrier protein [Planctomycetota bacterium]